jgi:hypothetical protein
LVGAGRFERPTQCGADSAITDCQSHRDDDNGGGSNSKRVLDTLAAGAPNYLTMPAVTALIMAALSLGMINSNANYALLALVTSDSEGGSDGSAAFAGLTHNPGRPGVLRLIGQNAGWFGPALGLVLHVVTTMLLLALFIWWNASALDRGAGIGRCRQTCVVPPGLPDTNRLIVSNIPERDFGPTITPNGSEAHRYITR